MKKIDLLLLAASTFFFAASFSSAADIQIEHPKSGWRNSTKENVNFTQSVTYPASSVKVQEDQSKAALIQGKLSKIRKSSSGPYRLIVNGVAMPLLTDEASFSRPYLFGSGSNSVEIRSPDNKSRSRVQFYESNKAIVQPRLSILLSWDTNQTDLDLHVIGPDGKHCWYGERVLENGGALDIDVTTGYGPEIFSTPTPLKGTYLVYVNYYGSGPSDDMTLSQVTVVTNQNSIDEKKQTVSVPLRKAGELTLVHSFVIP